MDWKTRFPVGLALLAALMLAGGVSAATSMKLASAHDKATVVLASTNQSRDPGHSEDPGESESPEESVAPEESEPPDESNPPKGDDQGVQGSSVERSHDGCELPEGAPALEGNWTHGEYVSVFARADDHEALVAAAHSQCGKPMKAGEHGKKDKARGRGSRSHGKTPQSHGGHGRPGKTKNHNS